MLHTPIQAPPPAITRVLARFDRAELAGFIAVAIDLLDLADGDTDIETTGAEDDVMRHAADGPGCALADAGELAGDETDGNCSEDDFMHHGFDGPGCPIADVDKGAEDEGECEQMQGDVPMPDVYAIEPDPVTGRRAHLGRLNLMTSFLSNGGKERSADSGRVHRRAGYVECPGVPV